MEAFQFFPSCFSATRTPPPPCSTARLSILSQLLREALSEALKANRHVLSILSQLLPVKARAGWHGEGGALSILSQLLPEKLEEIRQKYEETTFNSFPVASGVPRRRRAAPGRRFQFFPSCFKCRPRYPVHGPVPHFQFFPSCFELPKPEAPASAVDFNFQFFPSCCTLRLNQLCKYADIAFQFFPSCCTWSLCRSSTASS